MDTPDAEPAHRRPVRAGLVLGVAAAMTVGVVALVQQAARPRIEANERAQRVARLTAVLGDTPYDNDLLRDVVHVREPELLGTDTAVPVHRVRLDGRPVAALIEAIAPDGYSGSIRLLVAVAADGHLIGVRVLAHQETPGLGDAIEEHKSDWILRFAGRSLGDPPQERWRVRKDGGDFDQLTGATVTSRAVVRCVSNVLVYFESHAKELFDAPPGRADAPPPARN
jgi:electron transport complex protein RnfG